jgi:hypothetical protein
MKKTVKGSVEDRLDVIVWLHEGKRIIAIHDNAKKVFHRFNVSECKLPAIPNLQRLRINIICFFANDDDVCVFHI